MELITNEGETMDQGNQSQQPEQPVAPQTPPVVEPSVPSTAPVQKKSNKNLIIGLVVGGVVLLAIIVTLIVLALTVWSGPSKQDYRDAASAMQKLRTDYTSASSNFSSYASSATYGYDSSSYKEQFNKSFDSYKADVAGLKDLKALKDKDVKKAYDEFVAQNEKFVSFADSVNSSMDQISGVVKDCGSVDTSSISSVKSVDEIVPRYDEAVAPCLSAVKKLETASNTTISTFAKKIEKAYNDMRSVMVQLVAAAKSKDSTKLSSLESDLYDKVDDIRTASSDFASQFKKEGDQVEVKDQLNALGKLVTDKANK